MKFTLFVLALAISTVGAHAQKLKYQGSWHWQAAWLNDLNKGNVSTIEIDFAQSFGGGEYCFNNDCYNIVYTVKRDNHAWFSTDTVNRYEVWQTQPGSVLHARFWSNYDKYKTTSAGAIFKRQ